jgi:hypothetical protein
MIAVDIPVNITMMDVALSSNRQEILDKSTLFEFSRDNIAEGGRIYNPTVLEEDKKKDNENIDLINQPVTNFFPYPISDKYIQFNTQILVKELIVQFDKWENTEAHDSILYISNIKDLLDSYRNYLNRRSENRIFLSTLDIIFENDMWTSISNSKISFFKKELRRFELDGINRDNLEKFTKQIYRNKISLLENEKE